MPEDYANRRRHDRMSVGLRVRISTIDPEVDPGTGKPYFRSSEESCANVSRGGAFVRTPEPIAPGRRVLVDMEIPDGVNVQAIGRVAWSRMMVTPSGSVECGIGVEFLGGSPEHFDRLDRFLARRARSADARARAASPPSRGA
jgi:Tfp pilus assembly protein PilZ